MGSVITGLLTDAGMRGEAAVEQALMANAEIAGPWGSVAEQ